MKLTAEERQENDGAIEHADALATFLRGKVFAKIGAADRKAWKRTLEGIAKAYEALHDK